MIFSLGESDFILLFQIFDKGDIVLWYIEIVGDLKGVVATGKTRKRDLIFGSGEKLFTSSIEERAFFGDEAVRFIVGAVDLSGVDSVVGVHCVEIIFLEKGLESCGNIGEIDIEIFRFCERLSVIDQIFYYLEFIGIEVLHYVLDIDFFFIRSDFSSDEIHGGIDKLSFSLLLGEAWEKLIYEMRIEKENSFDKRIVEGFSLLFIDDLVDFILLVGLIENAFVEGFYFFSIHIGESKFVGGNKSHDFCTKRFSSP